MNVKLLRKIQRTILKHYRQVDMSSWFDSTSARTPRCGTTACIAGWAVTFQVAPTKLSPLLAAKSMNPNFLSHGSWMVGDRVKEMTQAGMEALDLTPNQADRLFFDNSWPEELSVKLATQRPGTKRYAQVVSERIDLFIKSKGRK